MREASANPIKPISVRFKRGWRLHIDFRQSKLLINAAARRVQQGKSFKETRSRTPPIAPTDQLGPFFC